MAVKIRLSRLGKKNRPYWRIIAIDSRKKRDGASLDTLGTYDPITHKLITVNNDRIAHWLSVGAQFSPSARKIIKMGAPKVG